MPYGFFNIEYHLVASIFFSVSELYNLETGPFITLIGEMDLALYEMYESFGLPMGEIPYEKYVPTREELHLLRAQDTLPYDTY